MMPRAGNSALTDHVIGAFAREELSAALAATHRAGFGPQARVLDGARGDVTGQLARSGLHIRGALTPSPDALLIVVTAPGRTEIVANLFRSVGAEAVYHAGRRDEKIASTRASEIVPDIRLGEEGAASLDG